MKDVTEPQLPHLYLERLMFNLDHMWHPCRDNDTRASAALPSFEVPESIPKLIALISLHHERQQFVRSELLRLYGEYDALRTQTPPGGFVSADIHDIEQRILVLQQESQANNSAKLSLARTMVQEIETCTAAVKAYLTSTSGLQSIMASVAPSVAATPRMVRSPVFNEPAVVSPRPPTVTRPPANVFSFTQPQIAPPDLSPMLLEPSDTPYVDSEVDKIPVPSKLAGRMAVPADYVPRRPAEPPAPVDNNVAPFCTCRQGKLDDAYVACTNPHCRLLWYHVECMGFPKDKTSIVTEILKGVNNFTCPECWVNAGHPLSSWPDHPRIRQYFDARRAVESANKRKSDRYNPFFGLDASKLIPAS